MKLTRVPCGKMTQYFKCHRIQREVSVANYEIAKENVIMVDDKEFMQSIEKLYDKSTEPHILIQPRKYFEKHYNYLWNTQKKLLRL